MRVRFGFDFDDAGRTSGLNLAEHAAPSALSVFLNPHNGRAMPLSADAEFVSGATVSPFNSFPSTFSGLSGGGLLTGLTPATPALSPVTTSAKLAGASVSRYAPIDGAPTDPMANADSLGGGLEGFAGGAPRHAVNHGISDGINDSSGPGKTARISQYFDNGQSRYEFSGNQDIDAELIGSKWTITNLTFSFPTSGSFYQTPYYDSGYLTNHVVFNAAQQNAVRYALGLIAGYTLLTFTEVTESNATHGNLRFSQTTDSSLPSAEGNFPGSDTWDGDIWFGQTGQPFYLTPQIGNWGQATVMHEIGHTMGLKHAHQDYTNSDLTVGGYIDGPGPRYGSAAVDQAHNGQDWTLMTYITDPTDNPHHFGGEGFNQPQTYMMDDIAALQYLYGANFNYNSGDTTYTFSSTTGQMFINGVGQGAPTSNKISRTIWDGNGIDTYDLSNYTTNMKIDLRPGAFSTFSTAQLVNHQAASGGTATAMGNVANALLYNGDTRSLIENAIGGSGADSIYGNDAANTLTGGSGNDYLYAYSGNDTNYGGAGNDTLDESLGSLGGNDYQFGESGDDDVYGGFGNDYVDGGTGNDHVVGNDGNDTLYGGTGNDTMTGGDGDDIYYVDSALDTVTEAASAGIDWVYSSITYTLGANMENLYLLSGAINGNGNSLNNVVYGSTSNNVIDMRSGGTDTVYAGSGNDTVYSSGYGSYYGENGNDYVYAAPGLPETLDGGTGTDTLDTTSYGGNYNVDLNTGVTNYSGESYVNFENVTTGSGNDSITGTAGNNIINTGAGNDTVDAGGFSSNPGDTVDGGDGNDELHSSGRGVYTGGLGNDTIFAGIGSTETLDGGAGLDWLNTTTYSGNYVINLTTGVTNFSPESFVNFENLTSGAGNDSLTGTSGNNTINGGAGNDTIDSLGGNDVVNGEGGNDTIIDTQGMGASDDDVYDGGAGIDTLVHDLNWVSSVTFDLAAGFATFGGNRDQLISIENLVIGGSASVVGSSVANSIIVNGTGANAINAGAGNDTVNAGGGNDTITDNQGMGASDDDVYDGGDGIDTLVHDLNWVSSVTFDLAAGFATFGGNRDQLISIENLVIGGSASVVGSSVANSITVNGTGSNAINAGAGNDTVNAGGGNDTITDTQGMGASDDDVYDGGDGIDTLVHDLNWVSSVTFDLAAGFATFGGNRDQLISIENLVIGGSASVVGSSVANSIIVNGTGANAINAGAGNDTVNAGGGDDTVSGEDGDDVLNGEAGNDSISGGAGNDTLNGDAGNDTIDGAGGNDALNGGDGNDSLYNSAGLGLVEVYNGGAGDDTVGGSFNYGSSFDGGAGNDLMDAAWVGASSAPVVIDLVAGTYTDGSGGFSMVNFESYSGFTSDETVYGTAGANLINGNDGNDSISGLAGDDTLSGGAGNDTIDAGANSDGTDTVDGGDGDDIITSSGQGTYTAGLGNDTVYAGLTGSAAENLDGGAGIDTLNTSLYSGSYTVNLATGATDYAPESFINFENIISGAGNDTITGSTAANWIDGGAGADSLTGSAGNDTYIVDDAGDVVVEAGGQGTDLVYASVSFILGGSVENLVLTGLANINGTGNTSNNNITGNDGNNLIDGKAGADSMTGLLGDDTYYVENIGDRVYEANVTGVDTVFSSITFSAAGQYIENVTLTTSANINALGNALDNILTGNGGDNDLNGSSGADTMIGGSGSDTYTVDNAGDVVIETGSGTDVVNSRYSFDIGANLIEVVNLTFGANVNAYGGTGSRAETLNGNTGANILDGRVGSDTMAGGLGNDTYYVDRTTDLVTENVGEGTDLTYAFVTYTLTANVENLILQGAANISGTGNTLDNSLMGNTGANKLFGLDGNDKLDGDAGNDTLTGGLGNDTYIVDSATDAIVELAGEGTDTVQASVSYTLGAAADIETLTLTGVADINGRGNALVNTINGNAGNNVLDGAAGADTMAGGLGNDTYVIDDAGDVTVDGSTGGLGDTVNASVTYTLGSSAYIEIFNLTGVGNINGTGNNIGNTITGNSGANILDGGNGADFLNGGAGNDTLIGGAGVDNFVFTVGSGLDVINDFKSVQNDLININDYTHGVVNGGGVVIFQSGTSAIIDLGGGNTITVLNTTAADPNFLSHITW